jgi:hypothetical protein
VQPRRRSTNLSSPKRKVQSDILVDRQGRAGFRGDQDVSIQGEVNDFVPVRSVWKV